MKVMTRVATNASVIHLTDIWSSLMLTASPALQALDAHHIGFVRGMPAEIVSPHADLVAHKFISEPEGIEPITGDGAVPQAGDRAAQHGFELALQVFELIQVAGVFDPLSDTENCACRLAGFRRRVTGISGVNSGEDRADDTERRGAQIQNVAVTVHERLGILVYIFGSPRVGNDEGVLVGFSRFDF